MPAPDDPVRSSPAPRAVDLRDYLKVLWKRRWIVAAVAVVTVASAHTFLAFQIPRFHASATILIEPEAPKVVNIQEVMSVGGSSEDYYTTQYKLIQSRPLVEAVIERLRLKERIPGVGGAADPYFAFLASLKVTPVKNTRLVQVVFESPDPKLAAEVANAVAAEYVNHNLEVKQRGAREAMAWLSEQLAGLRTQTQQSARALQTYQAKADLLGIQEQRQITQQRIIDLNRAHQEAQTQRMAIESKLRELSRVARDPAAAETIFIVADDPLIRKLKTDLSDLLSERSKLSQIYMPKHPDLLQLDAQIKQVNQRLQGEIQKMLRAVETEYKVARAREEALLASVNDLRREARALNEREAQALALQREKESTEELHAAVLKRLKETGMATALEANNVRIVEPATPPTHPARPRTQLIRILSVVAGLGLGVGVAFLAESLDNRIRSVEDVERLVGLPILGIVPAFKRDG